MRGLRRGCGAWRDAHHLVLLKGCGKQGVGMLTCERFPHHPEEVVPEVGAILGCSQSAAWACSTLDGPARRQCCPCFSLGGARGEGARVPEYARAPSRRNVDVRLLGEAWSMFIRNHMCIGGQLSIPANPCGEEQRVGQHAMPKLPTLQHCWVTETGLASC